MTTKVRVDHFTAEHQGADTLKDESRPARVDIWCNVEWIGQWYWLPETGIGEVRSRTPRSEYANAEMLRKITRALRKRGVV